MGEVCQSPPRLCENCEMDRREPFEMHRCRSNPDSCVDGIKCPDFYDGCECGCNIEEVA